MLAVKQPTQIASEHYTFDQRALGQQDLTKSERRDVGRVGWRLCYQVCCCSTQADATYFGEGIDGMLTMDYELTGEQAGEDRAARRLPAGNGGCTAAPEC